MLMLLKVLKFLVLQFLEARQMFYFCVSGKDQVPWVQLFGGFLEKFVVQQFLRLGVDREKAHIATHSIGKQVGLVQCHVGRTSS